MTDTLIIHGIQAVLRAAQAGADLYREHASDRKIFLPGLELPPGSKDMQLTAYLSENPALVDAHPAFTAIWNKERRRPTELQGLRLDRAYALMLELEAEGELRHAGRSGEGARGEARLLAAGRMVEQWREERQPPIPWVRMALTLTDIGLEFVSATPAILGVGSRGEKLIVAFASNLAALLPDDVDTFGPRADFADRVLGIFLRAGLGTLAANAAVVVRDEDVAKLVAGVTGPIVDALPEDLADQMRYRYLLDALAGPSAEAAFRLLAEDRQSFLGRRFADDEALGAVTGAVFREIQQVSHRGSIVDVFSEGGLVRLYAAGLEVALEHPELFAGADTSARREVFRELLRGAAETLLAHPRFEGPVGASLAAMVVSTLGSRAPALLKLDAANPWEKVAVTVIAQITRALSGGLSSGAMPTFSDRQILDLARTVLTQVAHTPGMLGVHRDELEQIVAGIAEMMAADDNLLLGADQWLEVAALAAHLAAANPGRLFGPPANSLANRVLIAVLEAAAEAWRTHGRTRGVLVSGETLAEILAMTLEALAGRITGIVDDPARVGALLARLAGRAMHDADAVGSQTLLAAFGALLPAVMATGNLPDEQEIDDALAA